MKFFITFFSPVLLNRINTYLANSFALESCNVRCFPDLSRHLLRGGSSHFHMSPLKCIDHPKERGGSNPETLPLKLPLLFLLSDIITPKIMNLQYNVMHNVWHNSVLLKHNDIRYISIFCCFPYIGWRANIAWLITWIASIPWKIIY